MTVRETKYRGVGSMGQVDGTVLILFFLFTGQHQKAGRLELSQ